MLNLLAFDDVLALYELDSAELAGLLTRLDRIGFIELLPNNRIKLLVARTFTRIPNGPIMQAFKRNAAGFFDSDFAKPGDLMLLLNGRLSPASLLALVERLKRVAREFSDQHIDGSATATMRAFRSSGRRIVAVNTVSWPCRAGCPET